MAWNNVWHHGDWIAAISGLLSAVSTLVAVWAAYRIGKRQTNGLLKQDLKAKIFSRIGLIIEEMQTLQYNAQKAYENSEDVATFNLKREQAANRFTFNFMLFQCELDSIHLLVNSETERKIEKWKMEMKEEMDKHNEANRLNGPKIDGIYNGQQSNGNPNISIEEYGKDQKPLIMKMNQLYTLLLKI